MTPSDIHYIQRRLAWSLEDNEATKNKLLILLSNVDIDKPLWTEITEHIENTQSHLINAQRRFAACCNGETTTTQEEQQAMINIEFYPDPHDGASDVLMAVCDMNDTVSSINRRWKTKQIYRGVRGPDVYHEVACEDIEQLRAFIEALPHVASVEIVDGTMEHDGKVHHIDLRITLDFPRR